MLRRLLGRLHPQAALVCSTNTPVRTLDVVVGSPNAAHYAEDDVGEGKSVDVYPSVFGLLRATRAPDRSGDMAHAG